MQVEAGSRGAVGVGAGKVAAAMLTAQMLGKAAQLNLVGYKEPMADF